MPIRRNKKDNFKHFLIVMELKNGSVLQNGRYRILGVLGQGGFGITYLAEQVALGRKVAIKEFFMKEHCNRIDDSSFVTSGSVGSRALVENFKAKFLKEARLIATFNNVHIISIYDVFEENGTAYYVMEYLEGKSLAGLLEEQGCMSEVDAVKYIRQVADALAEVHANNLLHLDIKPANIMLNKKGEAVLIDFGISKHYDESGSQTSSGHVGLSDGYAPMEQYKKDGISSFSQATDIYSLGATLYKMLTGNTPPHACDINDDGLPAMSGDISEQIRSAVEKAMQPRRKERPQNVEEFLLLLGDEVKTEPIIPDESATTMIIKDDEAKTEIVALMPEKKVDNDDTVVGKRMVSSTPVGTKTNKTRLYLLLLFSLAVVSAIVLFAVSGDEKSDATYDRTSKMDVESAYEVLQAEVDASQVLIGQDFGNGVVANGCELIGDNLYYYYKVDESLTPFDQLRANKNILKKSLVQMLERTPLWEAIEVVGGYIEYNYVGNQSGEELTITLRP